MSLELPQRDGDGGKRAERLAKKRETYRFAYDWPPGVATSAELPKKDDYSALYMLESAKVYFDVGVNVAAMAFEGQQAGELLALLEERFRDMTAKELHEHVFRTPRDVAATLPPRRPESWDEYRHFFATWEPEPVIATYDDAALRDESFAWQRVAGVNPMVLRRCDGLPENLSVDDALFQHVMGDDDSLSRCIDEERLYVADYAILDGVETGETLGMAKHLAAPIALFAVPAGGRRLRPVAIQLGQTPDHPVFTPSDGWRWRVAMMHTRIADANVHEGVAHLGRTHMVMEATKLCMERQLDERHPIHRLLEAHVETTLAINHSAKTSLIAPGGTVDHCFAPTIEAFAGVVKTALDSYPLATATPREDLEARGLMNTEALDHPYRDDVLLVFEAVERFVREYLSIFYERDADVVGDAELQAFVRELGATEGGRLTGVPSVSTVDELVKLVATLVHIAGPGHSAVNFPQFPFMGFVPNMTGASYEPVPGHDLADEEHSLTNMLPPLRPALEGVTMVYFLSNLRSSKLGHYKPFHFRNHAASKAVHAFQRHLKSVEGIIDERERERFLPYPFLKPSLVLQSISI
jgi:arachidonate 15-lipoxygenase